MFSSQSFMVSGCTFKSLIHFELIFVYGVKIVVQFHSSECGCPIFSTPCTKETILPPLSILGSVVNYELTVYMWVYF